MEDIVLKRKCILKPQPDCPFASEMTLNPAVVRDPRTDRLHMLIRVSGPWPEARIEGKPMPYPIFMAYSYSDDGGETFTTDLSRPALSPRLKFTEEEMYVENGKGERVIAYHNGCIEDPRLFFIEDECYLTLACRTFPAGPYWIHDEPTQCTPEWALDPACSLGVHKNPTVNVLYKVDLDALTRGDYEGAFKFITTLTDPKYGEDRDVFFFPRKLNIDGKMQYVMVQRPVVPCNYPEFSETRPSIVLAAAPDLYSFQNNATRREILYSPSLEWQGNRVGGSTPPIDIGNGEWLFNFHGKQDDTVGYTQSFMILKERDGDFPEITHLYPKRWIVNEADFEEPRKFGIPCVFFTGAVPMGDKLLVSYGAADEFAAVMELDMPKIISVLRNYPYNK